MRESGNISPQQIAQHGEKDREGVERRTILQKIANKKQQLEYSEESSSNETTNIIEKDIANLLWNVKLTVVYHSMEFHIQSSINCSKMEIPNFKKVN